MARARDVAGFECDEQFALVAARVVEVRAAEVFGQSAGVLDLEDVEPLHDMRVATRRLRAALEVFEPCFPRKRRRKALKRVKALADALGERRDRDVSIEALGRLAESAPKATGRQSLRTRRELLFRNFTELWRQASLDGHTFSLLSGESGVDLKE